MKKAAILICFLSITALLSAQIDVDRYLWEYPLQQNLQTDTELIAQLQSEMQTLIDSGSLNFRPLTCRYGDQIFDNYVLYHEPGRLLQTVALAYPYLTSNQQTSLRQMVSQLLANSTHAPWSASPLPPDAGMRRELFPSESVWSNSSTALYRPTIHNVYSLWLYLYRTGDTATIQPWYNTIRTFYNNKVANGVDPGNLYGTMSSHLGMARLASVFNDNTQLVLATANLTTALNNGVDVQYVDSMAFYGRNGWNAPYAQEYESRKDNWIYRGFIFLNLSPEIGRYLKDTIFNAIAQRHNQGMQRFPLWWMRQSPYFTRWTGDESVGIPTESFGMFMPVERWVINRDASTLSSYMLSSPVGVADCYWIEGLVYAIESNATDVWVDVRTTDFETDVVAGLPVVVTSPVSGITSETAISGGNITYDGGAFISARGLVWSTSANPTLQDSFTINGNGTGSFTGSMTGLQPNTTYTVRAYATNSVGTSYGNSLSFNTMEVENRMLSVTVFLEGLYEPSQERMRKALNETGENFPGETADLITVKLAASSPPYYILASFQEVELNRNGICTVPVPSFLSGSYYLLISHRNSIESWSSVPLSFTTGNVTYNFSDNASKTYGNNAVFTGNRYCIFGGDVNQDGVVDTGDMTPVDNDSAVFAAGYLSTDVNGDGIVDTGDATIVDNNSSQFIGSVSP